FADLPPFVDLAVLGVFLAGVTFLVALPFAGEPVATDAPVLAFGSGFGFVISPRVWICSQMRPAAVLALLKLFTASTPARLFHMATNRSAGHLAASDASSFWLVKNSDGVVAAAASSGVANALMLLSLSMVNVFM